MSENMFNSAIKQQMAELRAELYVHVDQLGLDDSKVLEFSRKLDLLILEIYHASSI